MTHLIAAHFQSSNSAAQASAAQILHAQTGGLLMRAHKLDMQGDHVSDHHPADSETALQDLYCTLMTSTRGGIIDVSPEDRKAMIAFIQARLGVLTELKIIIVSTSPDAATQQATVEILEALRTAGVASSRIRILGTDAPANSSVEETYPVVAEYASQARIVLPADAVLPVSASFAKANQFRMPIAAVLNHTVDFETELTAARLNGVPEKIMHALAHKVIAQRDLLDIAETLRRLVGILDLPCISEEEWRTECAPATNRKRAKTVALD